MFITLIVFFILVTTLKRNWQFFKVKHFTVITNKWQKQHYYKLNLYCSMLHSLTWCFWGHIKNWIDCLNSLLILLGCFSEVILSFSFLHPQVVQTLEDHHQEVLSLYRDYAFAGLIAQDSEFALCNVPAYFSSHALKLSWNGKNLTTHQYLLSEAARQLELKTQHLPLFAALLGKRPVILHTHFLLLVLDISLLNNTVNENNFSPSGNHILPDEDLAAFHWSLLGPEHPLASLKVLFDSLLPNILHYHLHNLLC